MCVLEINSPLDYLTYEQEYIEMFQEAAGVLLKAYHTGTRQICLQIPAPGTCGTLFMMFNLIGLQFSNLKNEGWTWSPMEVKIYTYNLETLGDWLEEYQWGHGWTSATKVLNSHPYLKADDMESLLIFFHERVPQAPQWSRPLLLITVLAFSLYRLIVSPL